MPTLNAGRVGTVAGNLSASFAESRVTTGGGGSFVSDSPTTATGFAIQSLNSGARGGFRQRRTYIYFDTSGITSTPTEALLKIEGSTNADSTCVLLEGGDAFGGDGDDALTTGDFTECGIGSFTVIRADAISWSTGTNTFTLNSTARSALASENDTVYAVVNNAHDFLNSSPTTTTNAGIDFSDTIFIDYTLPAGASEVTSISGIVLASIEGINAIEDSNIEEINTITF